MNSHGHAKRIARTRTYMVWQSMRQRCVNKNRKEFYRYGGRGIEVCKRWGVYVNFLSDMGEAPGGSTLERINNDGNYEPANCCWASRSSQQRNSSNAKIIEFRGEYKCVRDWEKTLGLSVGALHKRIKLGWPLEKALTEPKRRS